MPGKVTESLWEKAKAQAKKQYPEFGKESPRYWKVVSSIYKKMGGKFSSEAKKSLDSLITKCEQLEKETPSIVMDKSLFMDIKKDIKGDTPLALLLQFANYMLEGGRFITKSQASVDVSSLIPNYEITKSNIISTFTHESSTPIINMLKAMVSHPHKYLERAKTPSGKWRYIYRKDDPSKPDGTKTGLPIQKPAPAVKKEATATEKKEGKKEIASESFNRQKSEDIEKIIERMKTMKSGDRQAYLAKMPTDLKLKIKARLQKSEGEDLDKGNAEFHAKDEHKASKHYAMMSKEEKDEEEKKKLKKMSEEEKKHAEHFDKKAKEGHKYIEHGKPAISGEEASKSQANPEMDAWVSSRLENVKNQIVNNNPALEKSQAEKFAKEMLENMFKRGLR